MPLGATHGGESNVDQVDLLEAVEVGGQLIVAGIDAREVRRGRLALGIKRERIRAARNLQFAEDIKERVRREWHDDVIIETAADELLKQAVQLHRTAEAIENLQSIRSVIDVHAEVGRAEIERVAAAGVGDRVNHSDDKRSVGVALAKINIVAEPAVERVAARVEGEHIVAGPANNRV